MVKTNISNEETRRKDKGVLSQLDLNMAQQSYGGRNRHRSPHSREKSHAKSKSRGKLTCFYCGKPGHFQKDYRHLKKDKGTTNEAEPRKIPDGNGTSAITTSEEDILFICEEASSNIASEESTWEIDSGASFYINPARGCFSSYIACNYGYLKLGDNGECRIVTIGSVCLTTSIGCRLTLKDIQHGPDIRLNIIFTGRLSTLYLSVNTSK